MTRPRVFIFSPIQRRGASRHAYDKLLDTLEDAGYETVYGSASWQDPEGSNEEEMCALAKGAVALEGGTIKSTRITGTIMDCAPELRIIAKQSIGVDDVDLDEATQRGILVTNSPTEANWSGVAEGTFALMITLLKKVRERDEAVKQGGWRDLSLEGIAIGRQQEGYAGLTIGIVGLGRVGRRFADLLAPWGVRILGYDPYVEESQIRGNLERADLQTLLKESEVVSLHVVLTKETEQMLGAKEFALMKPGAILINTARGQLVNTQALVEALQSGHIAAAGLDVFEDEPLHADSPLLTMGHKVLLSPHMASANLGGLKEGIICANRAVLRALAGNVPEHVKNKEAIPKWLARFGGHKV